MKTLPLTLASPTLLSMTGGIESTPDFTLFPFLKKHRSVASERWKPYIGRADRHRPLDTTYVGHCNNCGCKVGLLGVVGLVTVEERLSGRT